MTNPRWVIANACSVLCYRHGLLRVQERPEKSAQQLPLKSRLQTRLWIILSKRENECIKTGLGEVSETCTSGRSGPREQVDPLAGLAVALLTA